MSESPKVIAYIALGSNLGDRARLIRAALDALARAPGVNVTRVSTLHETPAVGGPEGSPPFLNAAAEIETTLSPRELLSLMLEIEQSLGRRRREKWSPRTIDLDLLLYADRIIDEPTLHVPHPLMHEREFVLRPLAEIAPDAVHPVLKLPIRKLLEVLPESI